MADELVVSDVVTSYFLNTCRLRPQLSHCAVQAVERCARIAVKDSADHREGEFIPLTTGSVAEFYIESMLPHANDIDVMYYHNAQLAIPQGCLPPTQLPDEFHNCVQVFEMVDSHLSGYVYLLLRYLLTECIDHDKYSYCEYEDRAFLLNRSFEGNDRDHGPALLYDMSHTSCLSVDDVPCVRCLSWPPHADDWPKRHRNYNWPDLATVERVVNNGCDVVGVAHRQCKQDEWMDVHQWRLSFSRAEITLINSWMPVQQIVYHMLRFFVKNELRNSFEAIHVSNYHIKTLMMWACELKSSGFWTEDLNLVRICVELLHTLSIWLTYARCKHYFIKNCNLINNCFSVEIVALQLKMVDEMWLSNWFVTNYIQKFSLLPVNCFSGFSYFVRTNAKLQNMVSEIVNWALDNMLIITFRILVSAEHIMVHSLSDYGLTVRSSICWLTALANTHKCLQIYFTVVAFLHVADKISRVGFTDELMDVLATVAGQSVSTHCHPCQRSSEFSLSKATELMKVVANSLPSTMRLIEIELSKAYLYRALRCKDSGSNSIYCLANVYLAVLYYSRRQYRKAIDHCTLVMRSQDHSQCSSHVVQGEILPKIDDNIDSVLGLTVFYQYVQTAALNQRQTEYVNVLTSEVFTYCLYIRCLTIAEKPLNDDYHQFKSYLCSTHLVIADALAVKSIICNCHLKSVTSHGSQFSDQTDQHKTDLVELLQQSAVERMKTYRELEVQDFGSVVTTVTTDFEALYAYKRGNYQQCLQLSAQNVCCLLHAVRMPSVPTFPAFLWCLDDDIVSLTALTLMVIPECRSNRNNVFIGQLTLSLYLMTQCQLKLRHSVMSLAQSLNYIKVAKTNSLLMEKTLDLLALKMMERKILTWASTEWAVDAAYIQFDSWGEELLSSEERIPRTNIWVIYNS